MKKTLPFDRVMTRVRTERERQEKLLRQSGKFSCAARTLSEYLKISVLVEEVGEVAKEVNKLSHHPMGETDTKLRIALIHVAAVAVAWLESMEHGR